MEKLPLSLRIRKESHRKIAYAQDLVVEEVYKKFEKAVLHGGTAIWRCFSGKRFSEDLDFYLPRDEEKIKELFCALEKKGFRFLKKKIGENSVYSELLLDRTAVRLEATFQRIEGVISDYEASDGNIISIYSLDSHNFIKEKVSTYLKRRKVRDLWDIFFLLRFVDKFSLIAKDLGKLIKEYCPPLDEPDLKAILLEGIVPSSKEMLEYIKRRWEKEST